MPTRSAIKDHLKQPVSFSVFLSFVVLLISTTVSANPTYQLPGQPVNKAQREVGSYWVQLYAISQAPNKKPTGVLSSFEQDKIIVHKGDKGFYRILLGPYTTYIQGQVAQSKAQQRGITGAFIRFTKGQHTASKKPTSFWLQVYTLRNEPNLSKLKRQFFLKQVKVVKLKSELHQVFVGPFESRQQAMLFKHSHIGIADAFLRKKEITTAPTVNTTSRHSFVYGSNANDDFDNQFLASYTAVPPLVVNHSVTHPLAINEQLPQTLDQVHFNNQHIELSERGFKQGIRKVTEYGPHKEYKLDWDGLKGGALKRRSTLSTTYHLNLTDAQLYWNESWSLGGNIIYDHRRYANKRQFGVGLLAQSKDVDLYAYSYKGLSDWQPSSWKEEHNTKVNGVDLGIKGRLPEIPDLELGIKTYKLFGLSTQDDVGYAFSAQYNPSPAVFFRLEHDSLESDEVVSQAEIEFLYRFGVPFKEQF